MKIYCPVDIAVYYTRGTWNLPKHFLRKKCKVCKDRYRECGAHAYAKPKNHPQVCSRKCEQIYNLVTSKMTMKCSRCNRTVSQHTYTCYFCKKLFLLCFNCTYHLTIFEKNRNNYDINRRFCSTRCSNAFEIIPI